MTGIERLRQMAEDFRNVKTAGTWHGEPIDMALDDIADQISREHAEDCFKMGYRAVEDIDAIAWISDHGGLDAVRDKWDGRVDVDAVSRMVEAHKAKRERIKAHALGLERKCSERGETIRGLRALLADVMRGVQAQCEAFGVDVSGCETTDDMLRAMGESLGRRLMLDGGDA